MGDKNDFWANEAKQSIKEEIWRAKWAKSLSEAPSEQKPEIQRQWDKAEREWKELRSQRLEDFQSSNFHPREQRGKQPEPNQEPQP